MSWATGLMGLGMRGFCFILKEMGSYRKLSYRSDSFCFVTNLTKLSCPKAVWSFSIFSSEGKTHGHVLRSTQAERRPMAAQAEEQRHGPASSSP